MTARQEPRRTAESRAVAWAWWLLLAYPRAWRERYGEEVMDVLRRRRITPWTLADLLAGAYDVHLHRDLLPERLVSMTHRIRTSEIAVFCAYMVFALVWALSLNLRDPLPLWNSVTQAHPEIQQVYILMQITGLVAFLAILAGGLPILWNTATSAIHRRQRKVLLLLSVPAISAVLFITFALFATIPSTQRLHPGTADQTLTPLAVALQMGLLLSFLLGFAASVAAISVVVARGEVSERLARFALAPSAVTTLAIGVTCAATAVLTWLCFVEAPELGPVQLLILAVIMALALALAAAALRRGLRAARGGFAASHWSGD